MKRDILIGITSGGKNRLPGSHEKYIQSVEKAGAKAEFIFPGNDIKKVARRYKGFIIPGGRDLPPSFYGEEILHDIVCEQRERVDFENSLLHEIIKQGMPVLGICYGMQLLNVFYGGTLYQDIGCQTSSAWDHRSGMHMIGVLVNPFLAAGRFKVNSTHHQAVKGLGRGMEAFAFADDGIIEGLCQKDGPFSLGVQFHAERMNSSLSEEIFGVFLENCRGR